MIRKNSLFLIRLNSNSKNKPALQNFMYDENYLLGHCKPLNEREISKLKFNELNAFVDNVLTDRTIGSLLYESCADKEIKLTKKNIKDLHHKKSKSTGEKTPTLIIKQKERIETIGKVVLEAKMFKDAENTKKRNLTKKNISFYSNIITEAKKDQQMMKDVESKYRKERFLTIFDNLKEKLKIGRVALPDIKMNTANVFSRLYHNVVCIDKPTTEEIQHKALNTVLPGATGSVGNIFKNEPQKELFDLKIKHAIKNVNGREFTSKISDNDYSQCLYKYSGGPNGSRWNHIDESSSARSGGLFSIKDHFGNTLLHESVAERLYDLTYYLLNKGLNPNEKNISGDTPLHFAVRIKDQKVIRLLLQYGASADVKNKKNETPFDEASLSLKNLFTGEGEVMQTQEILTKKGRRKGKMHSLL